MFTLFSHVVQARPEGPEADNPGQHALKGQKLLAQGSALGYFGRKPVVL